MLVTSHIDYDNAVLVGLSDYDQTQHLLPYKQYRIMPSVQNYAAIYWY